MTNQTTINPATAQTEMMVSLIVNAWANQNKAITNYFNKYKDAAYLGEVAPGRNRAIYLLGHLISSNDSMLPMFGLGEKLYPGLEEAFLKSPDKEFADTLTIPELKVYWETLNETLAAHFSKMQPQQWLSKHSLVSDEDFALAPQRNKLNVLLGRTLHQSYHAGQLNLLAVKELAV